MPLLLTITRAPDSVKLSESSKVIGAEGGTIGRGEDNLWVLQDPERYLSGHHCQISCEGGQYFLTDLSTNGTFYQNSPDPMGKGMRQALADRDVFMVGDYEFRVQVQADAPGAGAANLAASPFDEPASTGGGDFAGSPFASSYQPRDDLLVDSGSAETDPLAALDKARSSVESPAAESGGMPDLGGFGAPAQPDNADPLSQQLDWPKASVPPATPDPFASDSGNLIPDDWDDDFEAVKPTPAAVPPVPAQPPQTDHAASEVNARLQDEIERLQQQLEASQQALREARKRPPPVAGDVDTTMIHAMGIEDDQLSPEDVVRINRQGGEAIREMVQGLMQVLGSRSAIKNEFRMNVTTIQPVENNPLKFSANVDDALENMFIKQSKAYKKPVEAVQASFEDIAEHQVAVLAGIREAFRALIDRFDPAQLEERFTRQQKGGLMIGSQKSRNWEAYTAYFDELVGDFDKSFQYLFGDGFVRAYEDQLQKLAIAKKSRKNDTGK